MSIGRVPGATGIQPSIVDAKGDLIVATAADSVDRLAVGSANQVLTVDSSTATGLKWATPAAPAFVGARIFNSTTQSLANSTWTAITMNSETYDTDGFHSTSTNTSRITIPTGLGGYYLAIGNLAFAANATSWRGIGIYKNGSEVVGAYTDYAGGTTGTVQIISDIMNLVAGDYIELYGRQNSGGNLNTSGASNVSWFTVMKVG
jgi:hypothetical protein